MNVLPYTLGTDRSENLAKICAQRSFEVSVSDALILPYRSDVFDVVICIALLHHLSTHANRMRVLQELVRICRVGGQILVTAWALEQNAHAKRQFDSQDVMVPWKLLSKYVKETAGKEELQPKDAEKVLTSGSFHVEKDAVVLQRYCHVYKQFELEELWNQISEVEITESFFDAGNWCTRVVKKS